MMPLQRGRIYIASLISKNQSQTSQTNPMRLENPPTLLQTNKRSIISLIIILSMVFLFATLIVFTIFKCQENCTYHNEYSFSCLDDGSLYCCKANVALYPEKTCGQYSQCQFDNSQCSDLMISLSLIGGILMVGVAVMIAAAFCPKIFWKSAVDQTTVDSLHARIRDRLIEEKAEEDTNDSPTSSTVEPASIN